MRRSCERKKSGGRGSRDEGRVLSSGQGRISFAARGRERRARSGPTLRIAEDISMFAMLVVRTDSSTEREGASSTKLRVIELPLVFASPRTRFSSVLNLLSPSAEQHHLQQQLFNLLTRSPSPSEFSVAWTRSESADLPTTQSRCSSTRSDHPQDPSKAHSVGAFPVGPFHRYILPAVVVPYHPRPALPVWPALLRFKLSSPISTSKQQPSVPKTSTGDQPRAHHSNLLRRPSEAIRTTQGGRKEEKAAYCRRRPSPRPVASLLSTLPLAPPPPQHSRLNSRSSPQNQTTITAKLRSGMTSYRPLSPRSSRRQPQPQPTPSQEQLK